MVQILSGRIEMKVPASVVWKAFTKDFIHLFPKLMPNLFSSIEIMEGDGGAGTILLFKFGPGVPGISYQKEKIAEIDNEKRIMATEVLEGGHREMGFSYYKVRFELKEIGDDSTAVEWTVEYDIMQEGKRVTMADVHTAESVLFVMKAIENHYLVSKSS